MFAVSQTQVQQSFTLTASSKGEDFLRRGVRWGDDLSCLGQQVIWWVRVHQAEETLSVIGELCWKQDGHCHGSFMHTNLHASTREEDDGHILRTWGEHKYS